METGLPKGLFVVGTDTGVGKTVVAAALASAMRSMGADAVPMKPVQTGCESTPTGLWGPDVEFCLTAIGVQVSDAERKRMAPYRFEDPCSPHLAAVRASTTIAMDRITESFDTLHADHNFVVVEGAGGILVPINGSQTMLDVMVALALPVVLVARPGLGTLNHTLLSLGALRHAKLSVLGVVFNDAHTSARGYIEEDNRATIEQMGQVPVLAWFPHMPGLDIEEPPPPGFLEFWSQHLAADDLLKRIRETCP